MVFIRLNLLGILERTRQNVKFETFMTALKQIDQKIKSHHTAGLKIT